MSSFKLDLIIPNNKLTNYINGKFSPADNYIDSENPATAQNIFQLPDSNKTEVLAAVESAKTAFLSWSRTPPAKRCKYLLKIADLIEENFEIFVQAESQDQGKTLTTARTIDIPRVLLNFRAFAVTTPDKLETSFHQPETNSINYSLRSPRGVVALISPWNLPLYLLSFKIAPVLAAGCTIVAKPSEMTSWTAWLLARVMEAAGLPPGVCNIVFGRGPTTGMEILRNPCVSAVSFTGSTATGEIVARESAPFHRKLSLELGGKNAGIIFNDVNMEKCLLIMLRSSYANQGEVCLCTSRIYVQEDVFDSFVSKFVDCVKNLVIGPPDDPNSSLGALISQQHWNKVAGYVELAKKEGANILCGHTKDPLPEMPEKNRKGYFMLPTVITKVTDDSRLMKEEIFGPVVCISSFKTEDEVIARANNVKYGLCASIWTENVGRVHRMARDLDVGTVWVNCWLVRALNMPFGGVKDSGVGREGLNHSYEFFTDEKTVCIQHD
ncbi:Aldehyde dehydrogenase family 8 member A1-like [Oopsacas minuta]|uniref:Aldehyde dehydrogenase family 8 member A1-like n=1 Tax=Oopsacas minuta TaxID=111878 RepID=A0AAV7JJB6_9METZ|nr:Aldehyde dehydrogenase family 8 member A1-like [Oopsacas minuta]